MSSDASSTSEVSTTDEHNPACSRRAFLAGAATVVGGAMASAPVAGTGADSGGPSPPQTDEWPTEFIVNPSDGTSRFEKPREISREGYRLLAETEYQAQQNGNLPSSFDTVLNAVEDLGCDPTGGDPCQDKIADAAAPGVLIVFPWGTYRTTGHLTVSVDGPFGMVGKGYKNAKQPPGPNDKNGVIFDIDNDGPTVFAWDTPSGRFENFAVDQRGDKQMIGLKFRTDGYILGRNLRTIGPQSDNYPQGSQKSSSALTTVTSSGGAVRVQRYVNLGGGRAGTKESSGMPIVWAGASHRGTAQFIDCNVQNGADNGAYCGRTPGDVQIFRGLWRNNDVSQIRLSGKGSRADGVEIELDLKNYAGLGTKKGWPSSNGIKWDGKPTRANDGGGKIVNCDVRGLSEVGNQYGVGGLINIFPTASGTIIQNTRIVNKIDAVPIVADPPNGGSSYPPPPQPHRIIVKKSLITGPTAGDGGAISIRRRPNSLVSDSCLGYPSASPSDISGAATSNVGYGKCSASQGLSAPKKVGGSPGSGLPPLNVSYSGFGTKASESTGPSKAILTTVVSGLFVILFILFGMVILGVISVLGVMGGLAAIIGGDSES